jgi:hypothetical protein
VTWALYNLIERFLKVGPVGRQAEKKDKRFSINELIIDIRTPDVNPELIAPERTPAMGHGGMHSGAYGSGQKSGSETPLIRHPKGLAIYIVRDLQLIRAMSGDHGKNGGIMFERIGTVKVLVDGEPFTDSAWVPEVVSEWDLADILAKMKYRGFYWGDWTTSRWSDDRKREAYNQWIKKAYESRVELGLPVKPRISE